MKMIERIDNYWGLEFIFEKNEIYQASILHLFKNQKYDCKNSENEVRTIFVNKGILKLKINKRGKIIEKTLKPGMTFRADFEANYNVFTLDECELIVLTAFANNQKNIEARNL